MNHLTLPEELRGQWIWSSLFSACDESIALFRRSFELSQPGLDNFLWISANCAYQLFVNERIAGFGPRANQGENLYADRHDISCFLQSGRNVVALVVSHTKGDMNNAMRPAGLWCQLEIDGNTVLASDKTWHIAVGDAFTRHPRPRSAENQLMTEYIDYTMLDPRWNRAIYNPDLLHWEHPNICVDPHRAFAAPEAYLLEPAVTGVLHDFVPLDSGNVICETAWSQVYFGNRNRSGRAAVAASGYIYAESAESLAVTFCSDDAYCFFCNRQRVAEGKYADSGTQWRLKLHKGWNRLLLFSEPTQNSIGGFFLFPEKKIGEIVIRPEPDKESGHAWRIAGPLKLPLADATASLNLNRLETDDVPVDPYDALDMATRLEHAEFVVTGSAACPTALREGEFSRMRLDILRYGIVVLELDCSAEAVVDFTLGYRSGANLLPSRGKNVRATHTFCCREGQNRFVMFNPREVLFAMLSVRQCSGTVTPVSCGLEELTREVRNETLFKCSDGAFNRLWSIGVNTLRRSAAFVPQLEHRAEYDTYILDAYIDAVNMVVIFGDNSYAAARLRYFIAAQFENGDIPVLTFNGRHCSQAHQLFFCSVWALYNYRSSGDLTELKSLVPSLTLLWEFFNSLIEEKHGLIGDIDSHFSFKSKLSCGKFGAGALPTYANALFCRFLLSLSEILRICNEETASQKAILQAQAVADVLRMSNFDANRQLFVHRSIPGKALSEVECEYNLFGNFATLLGGVMSVDVFESFFDNFFNMASPYDKSAESRNPYFHFLFMETMFALGQSEWAIGYFREYWQQRICEESGSWLGWHGADDPVPVRFSEGNVVSPNVFLVREIAGIRSADAGHSAIYFNPAFTKVTWADLVFPTACGKLHINWRLHDDGTLHVLIDANYPVKILPEMPAEVLAVTIFELSETVTLLQKPKQH